MGNRNQLYFDFYPQIEVRAKPIKAVWDYKRVSQPLPIVAAIQLKIEWVSTPTINWGAEIAKQYPLLNRLARSKSPNNHEDLVQETICKAMENIDKFNGNNLCAWLNTILHNTFIKSLKKTEREPCWDCPPDNFYDTNLAYETFANEEYWGRTKGLDEAVKSVGELMLQGLTQKQIAERTGKKLGTVSRITTDLRPILDLPNRRVKR